MAATMFVYIWQLGLQSVSAVGRERANVSDCIVKKAELLASKRLFRYDIDFKLLHDNVMCDFCVKLLTEVADIRKNILSILNPGSAINRYSTGKR